MKRITLSFGILLLASLLVQAYTQSQPDEKLFQEAKILIFDKNWKRAQEKLEKILEEYPESSWFSQALFYKGKCLEEQEGKEAEALNIYKKYLRLKAAGKGLSEESEISIIDLAFRLFEKGEKAYSDEIERKLANSNKVIQYYAAFKLSYLKDKKLALKGVPVLKEIVKKERDEELRDRAKIALFRISPDALKGSEEEEKEKKAKFLQIRAYDKGKSKPTLSLSIPWALADLALSAISEEDKGRLRKEGYDLEKILENLTKIKGYIIEISDEDGLFKIWIE
ncbi:tetratricopeptide repeat protein [Acidobacteriota bacterium]